MKLNCLIVPRRINVLNKNQKLLLNDFIKDKTDLRLTLFAGSVNPNFKLDKKNKEQLSLLIADWILDNNNLRLKTIENYLGASANENLGNVYKPKQAKAVKQTAAEIKINAENSELVKKMEAIRARIVQLRNSVRGNPFPPQSVINAIEEAKSELFPLENEAGMRNPQPPEKSKLDIVLGILGHWENPESTAHEMIYGNRQKFAVQTNANLREIIGWLAELSGKQVRRMYCQNNEMQGGIKGAVHKPTWILTDADSGQAPMNDRFVTMVDGKISNLDLSKSIESPNLSAAGWAPK